jgi:transcriptional regulator with XRE-family HTH domain
MSVEESSPRPEPRKEGSRRRAEGDNDKYKELSRRLRAERERAGLTLRALAARLDISPSALSQIETGRTRPSVGSLNAITTELGVSLDSLFEPADGSGEVRSARRGGERESAGPVQRADSRKTLDLESGVRWERLTASPDPDIDFLYVNYQPGGASSSGLMRHSGREYGLVLEGELTVTVGFDEYLLAAGDSICFDSTVPHRLANNGETPALGVWFVIGRQSDPRAAGLHGPHES